MYKLLLCWRYLRTRYIALASIISVMLGVATMIVTNAVMEGFTYELEERIHGTLSDIVFNANSLDGFPDADARMADITKYAGQYIAGMSPTVAVPAMLGFHSAGGYETHQIMLIGIDDQTYSTVSDFGEFLQHPSNREHLDFQLKKGGYDTIDHKATDPSKAKPRTDMAYAGWRWRRFQASRQAKIVVPEGALEGNPFQVPLTNEKGGSASANGRTFDPSKEQHTGCVLGIGLCARRTVDGDTRFAALPGDDVEISYPTAAKPPKVLSAKFTAVDFYECKMSEYDSQFVFAPLRKVQEIRGMIDPLTGIARCNSIQIRLKDGADLNKVRDILRSNFEPNLYHIQTWQEKEGALIGAIHLETRLLNVLLFMIIAVAGFGILAIFYMIVVEKTRDIGILKSLGASGRGIMGIFLSYGLCLGIVGACVGMGLGLFFIHYINEIADFVSWILGQPVFDPSVYFFNKIPTIVKWFTVTWIVTGAMIIAVLASVLPARRAARLHPVEALRYE